MIGPSHFGRGLKKTEFTPPPQAPELPSAEWFAQAFHDVLCRVEDVGKDFRTAKERLPFRRLLKIAPIPAPTRNSKTLDSFVAYCESNPQLRFWQALLNWSGLPFIVKFGTAPVYVKAVDESGQQVEIEDTYNWEGRNG